MSEKKLFPGMTQQDVTEKMKQAMLKAQKQQAEEAERKVAEEKRKKEAEEEWKRYQEAQEKEDYHRRYQKSLPAPLAAFFGVFAPLASGIVLLGLLDYAIMHAGESDVYNGKIYYNDDYKTFKDAIKDAYFVSGKITFDGCANLILNVAALLLSVCVAIGAAKKRKDTGEAIDLMLEIKKLGNTCKIDSKLAERVIKSAPEIISEMSSEKRVYFDLLMDGHIEFANNSTFMGMALAVMQGHLSSHPRDIELILNTYDKDSIPTEILQYVKNTER